MTTTTPNPGTVIGRLQGHFAQHVEGRSPRYYAVDQVANPTGRFMRRDGVRYDLVRRYV